MTTWATPGSAFTATSEDAGTGLVGTIGVRISNPATDTDTVSRTTSGIAEYPAGSGIYIASLNAPTTAGSYLVIWDDGSGNYASDDLWVSASSPAILASGTDLCALADVRLAERLDDGEDTSRDELRQTYITDASEVIEDYCAREFADRGTLTRQFAYYGSKSLAFAPYDLRTVSSLTVDGIALTQDADFYLAPLPAKDGTFQRADFFVYPYTTVTLNSIYWRTRPRRVVEIVGTWGMATVPRDVKRATVETVKAWMHKSPLDSLDGNGEARTVGDGTIGLDLPWAARKLLSNYRVRAAA